LRGINRIIYTDIATDGSLKGPNFSSVRKMCETIPQCKIIASGGISCKSDVQGLMDLHLENLDGVIVGKALYDNRVALPELLELAAK